MRAPKIELSGKCRDPRRGHRRCGHDLGHLPDHGQALQASGSSGLNQKSQGAGYHVSGFPSEKVGRLKITKEQWEAYLEGLPDDDARAAATASTAFHCHGEHGSPSEGHLDANVCMFIGKAHAGDLHTTGYWCGK